MRLYRKDLKKDQYEQICLGNARSIQDVQQIVNGAKSKYESSDGRKQTVQKWLRRISAQTMHYAAVLDALAQHHPEYVALAWGAVKFVINVRPSVLPIPC